MDIHNILSSEGIHNTTIPQLLDNAKYKSREKWQEEKIYEEYDDHNLEKDLDEYRERLENETRDFEENMKYYNIYDSNTSIINKLSDYWNASHNILRSIKPSSISEKIYFKENVKVEFSKGNMVMDNEILFLQFDVDISKIQYIEPYT